MDPDLIVDRLLQLEAILVGTVIPVIDAGISLRRQNVGVGHHLVSDDALTAEISVVIFDERYRIVR